MRDGAVHQAATSRQADRELARRALWTLRSQPQLLHRSSKADLALVMACGPLWSVLVEELFDSLKGSDVSVHVWQRKELESNVLEANAISARQVVQEIESDPTGIFWG